ncbi:hypothetical protein N0V93_007996 [Gnomoniopsis smithogilvyi]|uniref:Fungal lipase-type domain-containing protein n=1 Tax=Gnomoniopsis smithogilvyi TaxID=1191159 RepID=A0A9W8YM52_9PEZI|nr:hypothetical protein N0V93_007996 [Gnomoniopsis smithogilvyi]
MKLSSSLATAFTASRMIHSGVDTSLDSRSITSTLLNLFEWMSEYAAAGYCNKDGTVGAVVSCDDEVCADLVSNGAVIAATLNGDWESTGGVVIRDDVNVAIVVSFSGTVTSLLADYILDVDILLESIGLCDGCEVHSGFHGAWDEMSDTVMTTVQALAAEYPSYSVTFTGHSLGAALATLGCAYWRADYGGTCEIYTFGSPRVGNEAFAEFVSAQAGNEYRMTHIDDPVPRLPSHDFGYYHTDVEYWLSDGSATTTLYTGDDVVICTGIYNASCNSAGVISTDWTAHSYYLRHISVCS